MTNKNFERAKEIERSIKTIEELRHIVHYPYPAMFSKYRDKKNGFCYNGDVVSFASLDEQTKEELKSSIYEIIDKRREELEKELENL